MKKGFFTLGLVLVFGSFPLAAQEAKPLIKLMPFFAEGISLEETRLVESLIYSYLSDFGNVLDGSGAPDYTLTGSIYLERDSLIFMLEIDKTITGDTAALIMTGKSIGELALKARSMVEAAFSIDADRMRPEESLPLALNEGGVLGTWRGEPGIEMIRLLQTGRGIAIFSSGASMVLAWTINNNILTVRQISPNSERFYHPLPFVVAQRLAAEAAPMVWELRLYENGNILRGSKTSTGIRYEGNAVIELIPNEIRSTEWIKSPR